MASSALSRSVRTVRSTLLTSLLGSRSSSRPITTSSNLIRCLASTPSLLRRLPPSFSQLTQQRFYDRRNSPGRSSQERPPTEMAPLFPGCDYNHWLIVMDKPGGENATKEQMIDCYVQTLSKVLGSVEEAKQKIYNVSCERYFGFGCAIDEETSNKLEGLPGVLFVLPDSYVDADYQDYGAELFQNGQIVPRPPERQRRINEITQPNRENNRPRYNDRTRHARRRENMR